MSRPKHRLAGVTIIWAFYAFGAAVLAIALFTSRNEAAGQIAVVHGFPGLSAFPVLVLIAVIAIAVSIVLGLSRMTRWGFCLTLIYAAYLLIVPLLLVGAAVSPWANLVWPLLVIGYLLARRTRYFGYASHKNGIHADAVSRRR